MNNRKLVIVHWNENSNIQKLVESFPSNLDITIFQKHGLNAIATTHSVVVMPENINTSVKSKNYIIQQYKTENFSGYLHIIEDVIELLKDPTEFISDIENTMNILDIHSYLGTVTDACNRIYSKYNPRLRLINDKPEWQKFNIKEFVFCSHSNTNWMIFNLEKCDINEITFNEMFTIDMFWIIEYLARRRNSHPETLYFMNQYLTCSTEHGVYQLDKTIDIAVQHDTEKMKEEDQLFKSLNINYQPDNNIDELLERLAIKLDSKI